MFRLALALLALAACAAEDVDPPLSNEFVPPDGFADGTPDLPMDPSWLDLGLGVAYQQVNTGNAVVIAYGGYTAHLGYTAAWATELVDAKLGAAGVGHIYAVKGPDDASYAAKEIANTKLRAHLLAIAGGGPIYVVAHSSGTFVAHELFAQLQAAGNTAVLSRIAYANLDGGGSGLTDTIVSELGQVEFVYAKDPTLASGLSRNAGSARALAAAYAPGGAAFEVTVPGTGCHSGAGWCLHDVVVTHRPHDPATYDLAHDYTDFAGRTVTTEYLDPLIAAP